MKTPLIGILGGMGPEAGLDLASKIIAETTAERDQDHVPAVLFSMPEHILNRTSFLLGTGRNQLLDNPAVELSRQIEMMDSLGVTVVGMACNTAHAAPIFDELAKNMERVAPEINLLHLIEETVAFIVQELPQAARIGVLGTEGTYRFRLYDELLEQADLTVLRPNEAIATTTLQHAINHPKWGIKAQSKPVSPQAAERVREAIDDLREQGAEAIVLGCTELPLATSPDRAIVQPSADFIRATRGESIEQPILIDPTRILARALIRESYPEKLAAWPAL